MKTNNSLNPANRKAVNYFGANDEKKTGIKSNMKTTGIRGRGRKKIVDDDKFADLNMGWESDEQNDIYSSWTGSATRRKNYNDDEDTDSYEGTGYARGRMDSFDDELNNDPYETFRRG